MLVHLDEWVLARVPDLVHVNCGLYDLKRAFSVVPNVPLEEYATNVWRLLTRLQSETAVVWAQTTPVDEHLHYQNTSSDRFEADVEAYNTAARSVVEELDVPINDLFAVIDCEGKARLLTQDGVHFTDEGSQILGESVAACLRQHLEL